MSVIFFARFFIKMRFPPALVAELVDAQDLKSCLPKGEYGFDSRLGHKSVNSVSEQRTVFTDFSIFWHCFCFFAAPFHHAYIRKPRGLQKGFLYKSESLSLPKT